MASKEYDNNCINCDDRLKKSTNPNCVEYLKTSKNGNQFPGWKPVVEPGH